LLVSPADPEPAGLPQLLSRDLFAFNEEVADDISRCHWRFEFGCSRAMRHVVGRGIKQSLYQAGSRRWFLK
jgi:hypothetical protein